MSQQTVPWDVKAALAFMHANLGRAVSLADIAQHCGVAERTLNEHFRRFLGLPPMRFLRRLRLAAAREALLTGADGLSVTAVAAGHQLRHLGRFSGDYAKLFGEAPSTTLGRARWARAGACGNRRARYRRPAEIGRPRRTTAESLGADGLARRALPLVFDSQPDSAQQALELLTRALECDAEGPLALALAAWCHGQLVMYNGTAAPARARAQALQLLRRSAVCAADDPLALAARGAAHMLFEEFDVAAHLVAGALTLDPSFSWAWGRSGWLNAYQGNAERAIEHFSRAIALDGHAGSRANSFAGIGSAHFSAGRYEAAAFWLQRAVQEHPGLWWANRSLSVAQLRLGNRLKALDSLATLRRHCPDMTVGQVTAAVPFGEVFLNRLGEGLSTLGLPH